AASVHPEPGSNSHIKALICKPILFDQRLNRYHDYLIFSEQFADKSYLRKNTKFALDLIKDQTVIFHSVY
ncbi:MAG: hypothetical protein PUC65_14380, partial [Clostridiales bacterium]|nr:hypothetical protein [Clostridiales bacterium]